MIVVSDGVWPSPPGYFSILDSATWDDLRQVRILEYNHVLPRG
jgi:hypothetical protein